MPLYNIAIGLFGLNLHYIDVEFLVGISSLLRCCCCCSRITTQHQCVATELDSIDMNDISINHMHDTNTRKARMLNLFFGVKQNQVCRMAFCIHRMPTCNRTISVLVCVCFLNVDYSLSTM